MTYNREVVYMFFIMGISSKEKKLEFDQIAICSCCGRYGHIEVYMVYMYFSLFFLPLFKWNKRYFARMTCCNAECELEPDIGRAVASGELKELKMEDLNFESGYRGEKRCSCCGFTTTEDYKYCPKCGREL